MIEVIGSKLSLIPKNLIPTLSIGLIIISILIIVVFFAMCIAYVNGRPQLILKKNDKKLDAQKEEVILQKIRYESLPVISGRIGEVLSLSGLIKIGPITKIFFQALEIIRNSTNDSCWRYNLPCFMMLGPDNSGKSTILNNLTFEHLSSDDAEVNSMWKLFKSGAIFEFPKINCIEDDKAFWEFLAELFIFIRPRRPLDGIIITIPADILTSDIHNIEKYATDVFEKIFKFQHAINFNLPMYIVVTKTDLIKGFPEFAYLLNNYTKQQMFGWSNPYTLNTSFSTAWIEEIFDVVNEGIRKTVSLFSKNKSIGDDLKKAILFESNFRKLREPLSIYLNTMFRSHNPKDGLLLRGVYFTGKQKEAKISNELIQPNALNPNAFSNMEVKSFFNDELAFVNDLFAEKIFKEYNIAYPIRADAIDMSKKIFRNKVIFSISATVASIGWFYGNYHIKNKINEHYHSISLLKSMMSKMKYMENNMNIRSIDDQLLLNKQAKDLLHCMPVIGRFDLLSIFVFQSWISTLRQDIMDTISLVFDSVVVRAMYIDLNINTKRILESDVDNSNDESDDQKDLFDINAFESFKKLNNFTKQISSIKRLSNEYNSIRKLEDRKSVLDLTTSLFNDKFEIVDEMKARLPNKNLVLPNFDIKFFQQNIEKKLEILFCNFINDVFNGIVEKILQTIVNDINKLSNASREAIGDYSTKDLAMLYKKTVLFTDIMKNKNFDWISEKHFSPTKEYVEIINIINESDVINRDCLKNLLRTAEVEFHKFKDKIRKYKTELTNKLLDDNLQKESADFTSFHLELKCLLDQAFICLPQQESTFTNVVMEDKILIWDTKRLKELSDLIDKYYKFADTMPSCMRAQYFDMYKTIARKCFYLTAQSMLGNSQIFDDLPLGQSRNLLEDAYKKQANNIRNATTSLVKVAKFFDEICSEDMLKDCGFTPLIIKHYLALLEKIDALFNVETPYATGNGLFNGWSGEDNPKYLDMADEAALRKYLTAQFNRIKFLAKDLAAPIVDLLMMPHIIDKIGDQTLLEKWKEIVSHVDDYDAKKPGNSIAALEQFISDTLKKVSMKSFDSQGEIKTVAESGGDYFAGKRSEVAKALMSRADIVTYDTAAEKYKKIATFFNTNLSNKFPFGNSIDDASLTDMENFVNIYDQSSSELIDVFEKNKEKKQINSNAINFLNSMNKVIPFLKSWIAHSKNSDPKSAIFTFNVLLRSSPDTEAFTSSLLERSLKIRNTEAHDNENAIFFNDDPVDMVFTWVDNADEQPYNKDLPKNLEVDGHVATFSYKGKWALFRLIEDHKANKEIEYDNGVTLSFEVPVLDKANGNSVVTSKMMLKITPNRKEGDKISPTPWPVFPSICPDLHGTEPNGLQDKEYNNIVNEISEIKPHDGSH